MIDHDYWVKILIPETGDKSNAIFNYRLKLAFSSVSKVFAIAFRATKKPFSTGLVEHSIIEVTYRMKFSKTPSA